jgi:hypothetical protein
VEQIKPAAVSQQQRRGRWNLLLVLLICASPMIFSYLTYYVIKPTARNNYGALIDPREHPIPATLGLTTLDGRPASLADFKGKWIMLRTGPADCAEACHKLLFAMRQLRLMQGKDMERLERIWLITDSEPVDTIVIREFDGTTMLRARREALRAWLPVEQASGGSPDGHLYLIDPLGNLMMRFPLDADPSKVKKDIGKLLKASAIG